MSLSKAKYILVGILFYFTAVFYLHFSFNESFRDFFIPLSVLGMGFSLISWLFTNQFIDPVHKPKIKNELLFIIPLIIWIAFYITYGGSLINKLLPASWIENPAIYSIIIFLRKLLFFVFVPFLIYKAYGFSVKDFGLKDFPVKLFSGQSLLLLILSILVLLFQYYAGRGGKDIQNGSFSITQFVIGIPLCLIYLVFDAGLIEEFFFRGFLQSRLATLFNSNSGGIVISAIIFGLVHAPGLYLRGAASEGIGEQMPFLYFATYTIAYMSVAGVFLGIIYSKTKNLWLVMILHAVVDIIPNFSDFIATWHIK
ncbi:MAG: CPBP family intramembrane metalloprotease [Sphingobacteriales bacterium]|nr:CPBP family intramembrane metalloprotease [Sphingobacteriales bacterium]